ncbi:MAG TPA: histidinol-phosphate transaminase [Spirochaetota bacterium]|jgi:histidinol-phosphate aminotransferase|nr:MAG: Histidinol-phosphate aminotransferase 2 [Spirochaetes bacterium ADurb.Bin133]HNZ26970.1 histidinol-phosphate transaminase [Spirochaetota bacterium]HPY88434.1 histidinol-phosphate transaminase [Spirochaetota bacterium]HQB62494.1 histidinol-phosphate transaminase [Spirochaetota bacterium]
METNDFINKMIKKGVINNKEYTLTPIETPIKLNQNESPFDIPADMKKRILDKMLASRWNVYPDFTPDGLYLKTAAYLGVNKENILIGNGSNEMIMTILAAIVENGRRVVIPTPTFAIYGLLSSNFNGEVIKVPLKPDMSFDIDRIVEESKFEGSVAVLCSPNNPTGAAAAKEDLIKVIKNSGGLVIIDEAYIQFGGETLIGDLDSYPNLIILRTFSKAFGLAGLRLGCMIGPKNIITQLSKVKLPYNLNILNLIALDEVLDNPDFVDRNVEVILKQKKYMESELSKIKQIQLFHSDANFFLFRVERSNFVFAELVKRGVLIRNYSSSVGLENCLRVSVGSEDEVKLFIESLKDIAKSL